MGRITTQRDKMSNSRLRDSPTIVTFLVHRRFEIRCKIRNKIAVLAITTSMMKKTGDVIGLFRGEAPTSLNLGKRLEEASTSKAGPKMHRGAAWTEINTGWTLSKKTTQRGTTSSGQSNYDRQRDTILRVMNAEPRSEQMCKGLGLSLNSLSRVSSADAIKALEKVDISPLIEAGVEPIAAFDFDNTLMTGDVFEHFLGFLAKMETAEKSGPLSPKAAPGVLLELGSRYDTLDRTSCEGKSTSALIKLSLELLHKGKINTGDFFNIGVRALKGQRYDDLKVLAKQLFSGGYKLNGFDPKPGENGSALDLMQTMDAIGVTPVIVSAGLEVLARAGARFVGVDPDNVVGSRLEIVDGAATGRVSSIFDEGKVPAIRRQIDRPILFAAGDSEYSDWPMLNDAAGLAFWIDPSEELVKKAIAEGKPHAAIAFKNSGPQKTGLAGLLARIRLPFMGKA